MQNLLAYLKGLSKPVQLMIGLALIGLFGSLDFLTGYELAFSLFYVLPILLVTWLTGRRFGLAASLISALVWFSADMLARPAYANTLIPIWNTFIRLAYFVIITLLFSASTQSAQRERELARTDFLTGALNSRIFYDLVQNELDRFQRYQRPFTIVYLDLDNFKEVNDRLGHAAGNEALRSVVNAARRNTRKTDQIARLGGDEFGFLLPETSPEAATAALGKLQKCLVDEMLQNRWPVTFSMGALTCAAADVTADDLVKMADDLMYLAKREGKNAVRFGVYSSSGKILLSLVKLLIL